MGIRIRQVHTPADKKRFIRLPWKIYRSDPNWVPPLIRERRMFLDPGRNPFFEHADVGLLLAIDDKGEAVGRIAAIVNYNHIKTHNENTGFFGLFESTDDVEVSHSLFEAAADFLRSRGMTVMRGPENLSINDDLGLLVKGLDSPPVLMMPYNPRYYEKLVETAGFVKTMDFYAYHGETDGTIPQRLSRGAELSKRRSNITLRSLNMKEFERELLRIRDIYNRAWEMNWGAVAMTEKEFQYLAEDLKQILDPTRAIIAEVGGKTAGFSLALPDFNQVLIHLNGRLFQAGIFKLLYYRRKINSIRILTLGILREYRRMGLDAHLIYETYRRGLKRGYRTGEMSWILETNSVMNNALINLGFKVYKIYRLYDRPL
jgi:GNAT superfamily N-acetyltransferase